MTLRGVVSSRDEDGTWWADMVDDYGRVKGWTKDRYNALQMNASEALIVMTSATAEGRRGVRYTAELVK